MAYGSKSMNSGVIKLKKSVPKHNKPGNWMDGSIIDGVYSVSDVFGVRSEPVGRAWQLIIPNAA